MAGGRFLRCVVLQWDPEPWEILEPDGGLSPLQRSYRAITNIDRFLFCFLFCVVCSFYLLSVHMFVINVLLNVRLNVILNVIEIGTINIAT